MSETSPQTILRPMTEADLEQVLSWRNAPEIRGQMFHSSPITLEEHQKWFKRCCATPGHVLLIYEEADTPCGFVQWKPAGIHPDIIHWGFYKAPEAARGIGTRMLRAAIDFAFDICKAHKIYAEVLEKNSASLHLHRKLGFTEEGKLREHYPDGNGYQAVFCFGLIQQEHT
jgi:UDP-4-amino-4,6-dideoxy-N-acetyl-beta-L-altrosamine N-acetyltransferase